VSWVTLVWGMVGAACLTLAAVHLPVWLRDRSTWPSFFFAMLCVSNAAVALCELQMFDAQTPESYAAAMRLVHLPILGLHIAAIGFVRTYLKTGRPWLGWTVIALRAASLVPNFLTGQSLNLDTITSVEALPFLGEHVSLAIGTPNPWMLLAQLATCLFSVFALDASISAWRRGDRRIAVTVGGGIMIFSLAGVAQALLVFWGGVRVPITTSVFSLVVVIAMAYELSREVLRAAHLVHELRESKERMSLAAEAADLGIWVLDFSRNTFWASARMRTLFGFSETEILDLNRMLMHVDGEDRAVVRECFFGASPSLPDHRIEFRVHLPDEGTRWIAAQGRVEFDERGLLRTRGACSDVTKRKESEQQLMKLRLEVAHAGRVTAMGHLASSLAHEINQPLGAILRNAEAALLLLQTKPPDLEEVHAVIGDILSDDLRAGNIIDRMRTMLRRSELNIESLAVGDLLSDVASLVRPDATARRMRVVLEVADDLPPVMGDSVHLQQVLLNLISNSMDAIEEAGHKARHIAVSAIRAGARIVEIAVSDSGPGIPHALLEQIFGSFYTTKPSGLGMGLSISRSLIEAHGGRMWAENRVSGGASLRFTLPASTAQPA